MLGDALAARGHDVVLALDPGHRRGGAIRFAPLGALEADDLAAIVRRALAAPTPLARSRAGYRGFFVERRDALEARLVELAADRDVVVVAESLVLRRGAGLAWPAKTAVLFMTPALPGDFAAMHELPILRLAALPTFATADDEIRRRWSFVGFFVPRAGAALDAGVTAFLASGPPPFFLTMGSMTGFDGPALARAFAAAARAAGGRAIIQRGWSGLAPPDAGDDLLAVDRSTTRRCSRAAPRCFSTAARDRSAARSAPAVRSASSRSCRIKSSGPTASSPPAAASAASIRSPPTPTRSRARCGGSRRSRPSVPAPPRSPRGSPARTASPRRAGSSSGSPAERVAAISHMLAAMIAIDAACQIAWERIDNHGTHALVVDGFLTDPGALRELALGLAFDAPARPDNYPGVKALASLRGAAEAKTWIADQVIARLFPSGRPPFVKTDDYDALGAFAIFA